MIDLLVSLVDRLLGLIKEGQARDRKLYEDFFTGFQSDMDRLHQNYLDSFARYRSLLQTTEEPLQGNHSLIREIDGDSTFTAHLRSRVGVLWQYLQDPVFGDLALCAQAYLSEYQAATSTLVNGDYFARNAPRDETARGLKEIFATDASDAQKRAEALKLLDWMMGDLQGRYGAFVRSSSAVRRKLLDKRIGLRGDDA